MTEIPKDHPRRASLEERHLLVEAMKQKILTPHGLIAAGRGEAFDYLFGEQTHPFMLESEKAAVATLLLAKHPVLSVNGNVAALTAKEVAELSKLTQSQVEVNLFYREEGRMEAVCQALKQVGITPLGCDPAYQTELTGISHLRRVVDTRGIAQADVVLVPLEDGDRTMALRQRGTFVISIDLNPLSRTALWSNITIVNHVKRALTEMIDLARELQSLSPGKLRTIKEEFDNKKNIQRALTTLRSRLDKLASNPPLPEV